MDRGVGPIVAKLEELGILDNTLILFLADNGGCAEELDAMRKGPHIPEVTGRAGPCGVATTLNHARLDDTYQSYGIGWANASNTPFRFCCVWVTRAVSTPLIAHWPARIRNPAH
jgi:arylsulfatase